MEIGHLIYKKLTEQITSEEEKNLLQWIQESEENKKLFERLEEMFREGHNLRKLMTLDSTSAWAKVLKELELKKQNLPPSFRFTQVLKYAAFFAGLFGFAIWLYTLSDRGAGASQAGDPLKNEITLKLSSGEVRVISEESAQHITLIPGSVLSTKIGNNTLNYSKVAPIPKLVYNTINIPNGKRFKLVLSDSTVVHLNSGSSLKYPVHFIEQQQRNVVLTGEAYFEVTPDRDRPFVVGSADMNIRVLGTKFNVTAYEDDPDLKTVLVEGSVGLYGADQNYDEKTATLLTPGYKATWKGAHSAAELEKVDTRFYTDWVYGKLIFRKLPFHEIVKKLQRHYNITITNSYKELDNQVFTATFDLEDISEVLDSFKENTPFSYEIKGSNVTIKNNPKNQRNNEN